MYRAEHLESYEELRAKVAALDPNTLKMMGAGLGGAAIAGLGTHALTKHFDDKNAEKMRLQTRNRAFGAGMSAGLATPRVARGAVNFAQNLGILPGGM